MRRDDAITERQTDTGADPHRLAGVKRLENAGTNRFRHPWTVVGEYDFGGLLGPRKRGLDLQASRRGDFQQGLLGIHHQIGENLGELIGVGRHLRQGRIELQNRLNIGRAQAVRHHLDRRLNQRIQRYRLALGRLLSGDGQESLDDPRAAFGGLANFAELGFKLNIGRLFLQHDRPSDHHGKRVVEFVGNSGQQGTQGAQFLALMQRVPLPRDLSLGTLAFLQFLFQLLVEQGELGAALAERAFPGADFFGHGVKGLGQSADFIQSSVSQMNIKISGGNSAGRIHQTIERSGQLGPEHEKGRRNFHQQRNDAQNQN